MKWLLFSLLVCSLTNLQLIMAEETADSTEKKGAPKGPVTSGDDLNAGSHIGGGIDLRSASDIPEAVHMIPFNNGKLGPDLKVCLWGSCDKNSLDKTLLNDKECEIVTNMYTTSCMAKRIIDKNSDGANGDHENNQ